MGELNKDIQIQHLLKLNRARIMDLQQNAYSNTTLVKVKLNKWVFMVMEFMNSNTTLVKVKFYNQICVPTIR